MAILSKIRDRSGFLIIIIGLAMLSFVVSPKDIIDFFSDSNSDVIGIVNGEKIPYTEYATRVENAKQQSGNRANRALYVENSVWDQMVNEKIYETKLEEAGIVIGQSEIWEGIISNNEIKNSPQFKNAEGVFSEAMVKEYVSGLQNDDTPNGKASLKAWINYEQAVKKSLLFQTYNDLISSGVTISKEEAQQNYISNNTKVSGEYVYLPYSSIKNTEVKVTEDDVKAYVNNNPSEYETEETRDVVIVKFPFTASSQDEEDIKAELSALVKDKEEYNDITKSNEWINGFANTEDNNAFISEVGSDLPSEISFLKESALTSIIKEDVTSGTVGDIVGPYKFSNYYKLSKLVDVKQLPDSVQASHILISYAGAQSARNIARTEQEAKVLADSLLNVIEDSKDKFGELAQNYSTDTGSAAKDGDLGWFAYSSMVPTFRDFCFENKKGDIEVVKTNFGYHIIHIKDQKDFSPAYKLATIARKIEASETTENQIFEQAETFANAVKEGNDFKNLAKEKGYKINNADNLKAMDTYVGTLGENRSVVKWSFSEDTDLKEVKRFDLDEKGYAIVMLTNKQEKGLLSAAKAYRKIEPILIKEKKAKLLAEKLKGADLNAIASANNKSVSKFNNVNLSSSVLSGVGKEPAVLGAASTSKQGELVTNIIGEKGVFALVTNNVVKPEANEISDVKLNAEIKKLKMAVTRNISKALKKEAIIEDFRASRY